MFEAGTQRQIEWADGNWIFLDIGFSGTQKTCGLAIGDTEPRCVDFAEGQKRIIEHLAGAKSRTNLVIEAPLSVSFRNGLPAPRSVERRDGKNRFWYVGPGRGVMVASMYLIKAIQAASPPNGVRLLAAAPCSGSSLLMSAASHAISILFLSYFLTRARHLA